MKGLPMRDDDVPVAHSEPALEDSESAHAAMHCCAPVGRSAYADAPPTDAPPTEAPLTNATDAFDAPVQGGSGHGIEQIRIPAQTFAMGDVQGDGKWPDGEGPVHPVSLDAFEIDATSVTTRDFASFVEQTGYLTEAESFGYSAVFHLAVRAGDADVIGPAAGSPWWIGVRGADWAHPGGPLSNVDELQDHPVVHISWNDAQAYCAWAGRSLPTEAQWECASRGGIAEARYPWGNDLGDEWNCNIWQGVFPTVNTQDDGWFTTAPVRSFHPNGYGLWQTVGNVWEWCSDWWDAGYYQRSDAREPQGPATGTVKALRGGSYLCHDSYCNRYRNSARSSNTPDSSMGNAGFRTVRAL
jgi:formylglycine-generating enzyme required for sulfatase activity